MTTGTNVALPDNLTLPAHLMTPEALAAIAAANAAAGGGIKTGGFPRISIKGGKFHLVKGGETHTILNPPDAPGAPALPKMLLQVVVVAANPAIVKTYYPGKFSEGDDGEPTCSSDNGQTPDSHIAAPQSPACATCTQNAWGSKISEASGKEIKACSDSKRLVILPAENLDYEAFALSITASALTGWGKYVKALSDKKIPINAVVTNVMFDSSASYPKLVFSFGRLLTAEEYAKVGVRVKGEDVQNIVSPVRSINVAVPLLPSQVAATPAPAASVVLTPATPPVGTLAAVDYTDDAAVENAVLAAAGPVGSPGYCAVFKALKGREYTPVAAAPAPAVTGFGQPAPVAAIAQVLPLDPQPATVTTTTAPVAEPVKRTRKPREVAAPVAVNEAACLVAGPVGSPGYCAVYKALTGTDYAPVVILPPAAGIEPVPVATPPLVGGFGVAPPVAAAPAAPPVATATPAQVAGANDLAAKLKAKLAGLQKPA